MYTADRGVFVGRPTMNMSKLNEWLTLLTNAAVVVGIIFLAVEVQQNNELLQSQIRETQAVSIQSASTLDQEFLLLLGSDAATAQMWRTYLEGPDGLTDAQRLQCSYLMGALLRRLESVHIQRKLGSLSEEAWLSRMALFTGIARSPGYAAYLESPGSAFLGKDLREYMEQLRSQ